MMNFCLFFLCVLAFIDACSSQDPTVAISADSEHVDYGKTTLIQCSLDNLDSNNFYSYSILYTCESYDLSIEDGVATWTVDNSGTAFLEINETISTSLGLKITQGEKGSYPDFEIKIELVAEKEDIWACFCKLNVFEIHDDDFPLHYYSQFVSFYPRLNAQIGFSTNPTPFLMGRVFNGQCTIDNFNPNDYIFYEVGFMLNNENNWIAYYEVDVGESFFIFL